MRPDDGTSSATDAGDDRFARRWREIAACFLKLGLISYGGPSLMAMLQLEVQQKRKWIAPDRFLEALGLVNMLPGAVGVQLGIFLGYTRAGWRGAVLAGLCVLAPGFVIMLSLTLTYAQFGATQAMRGALYGLGPIVLAVFFTAVYGLARSSLRNVLQTAIAALAAGASAFSPVGTAEILLLAGAFGIILFHSRKAGLAMLVLISATLAVLHLALPPGVVAPAGAAGAGNPPGVLNIALFFFKVGALTFGGGLTLIAFIQEQVVNQFHWLSAREFLDGLALGQFTPGPLVMVAAYVGYKGAGFTGAIAGAVAMFLPSFILMLSIYPVFDRIRRLAWIKAAMQGIAPAVIGVIGVALAHLAPHAVQDLYTLLIVAGATTALLMWRVGIVYVVASGAILGVAATYLTAPGA
jgi:chromate transporter